MNFLDLIVLTSGLFILIVLLFFALAPEKMSRNSAIWIHYRIHKLWGCRCHEREGDV